VLASVLLTTARRCGVCTSGPLFMFWFLMSLAYLVRYRSVLLEVFSEDRGSIWDDQMEWRFATIVIYCPVLMAQFLLSCLADTRKTTSTKIAPENHCPERNASFLSKLFFSWFNSVARGLYTTGEIVNLMSVDIQKVMDYIEIFNLLWVTPLLICVSIWLLWGQLGIATLGGIVVMLILLPINGVVTANVKKYQTRVLVTHRLSVLPQVDKVVVLHDGKITDMGTYEELLTRSGAFSDFLEQFLQEDEVIGGVPCEDMQLLGKIASRVGASKELVRLSGHDGDSASDTERGGRRHHISSKRSTRDGSVTVGGKPVKTMETPPTAGAKLTGQESSQVGSVKWWVYLAYIKAMGKKLTALMLVSYVFSHTFNIMTSYWLSLWSNDALEPELATDPVQRNFRLGMYAMYGLTETVFILVGTISLNLAAIQGSKILHADMLQRVLRSPMSFFDTTPMGRILN
ncbi:hypothetical protein V5799_030118, partial [Amblyomma americanum]